jgi:CDP-glycerol glycerophosphotransferase (TagB/SpsB family)
VQRFRPDAIFAASNWVPQFFPGAKVQVFHGFSVDKRSPERGHFRIRGLFDLYCTQGPATTRPFEELARAHGHFAVAETGWPKLDPLFAPDDGSAAALRPMDGRPVVLYAATFTEALSSSRALLDEIAAQIAHGDRYWLLTLHPKSDPALVDAYRRLAGPNARFIEADALVPALRAADVLVCDTSSVVSEFVVQRKPVVTFRNRAPKPHMIDIADPADLEGALQRAFAPTEALRRELATYADLIHPWRDGHSSERVLGAAKDFLGGRFGDLARKPVNLWRRLQMRAKLRDFGA